MQKSRVDSLVGQLEAMILDYRALRRQFQANPQQLEATRLRRQVAILEAENQQLRQQQREIRERLDRLLAQISIWEQEGQNT
ncbi:hypothetical protein [Candidatus Igneacidithiobacillus taiwanensis]|uniref:hypothetical protein n=1 Tax=Candidatus Igneacidithiobacillus taiwanensis TaxID=1945924 RepID=UPI00289AE39F|nr:hypothetical protein [Candidatus Igneacidithiobacillus taiwanensis]MCE5360762.1 hypothetical protein [Acidithiobacillus sp.]